MHIRVFDVATDVPVGEVARGSESSSATPNGNTHVQKAAAEAEVPEAEREAFDEWLRNLWGAKDRNMETYLRTGSFVDDSSLQTEVPLAVRSSRDILDAYCFFVPAVGAYLLSKVR